MKQYDTQNLIATIYRYYPRNLRVDDPGYCQSEEYTRLHSVLLACATHLGHGLADQIPGPIDADVAAVIETLQTWHSFVEQLRNKIPASAPWNTTLPWHAPCYSCRLSLPGVVPSRDLNQEVVILLSALAPVYAIYASHLIRDKGEYWLRYKDFPNDYEILADQLATRIEETFGFTRVYEDTLLMPIPDVVPRAALMLGEAQLVDLIFTSERY